MELGKTVSDWKERGGKFMQEAAWWEGKKEGRRGIFNWEGSRVSEIDNYNCAREGRHDR